MKTLQKLRLINWHYFCNITTDVKNLTFLTGPNGTGKSTIIDALQVIILGTTRPDNFNKAANEKGRSGRNGKAGDLIIRIHIRDDSRFSRDGKDVYITKNIPFTTAALGGEVNVDTLYGTVRCKVPAGSQPGSKLRLKNKGIVSMKNKDSYGDEYVIIQVDVPKNLTERERKLLQEFQEIHDRKTA